MRRVGFIILSVFFTLSGCSRNDNPGLSGTDTIDNKLYGTGPYYALGFSFSPAKKISTLNVPPPDITINADADINDDIRKIFLSTDNFKDSFYRYGEYADAAAASLAFKDLKSFSVSQWTAWGDSVKSNQIWLFRTSAEKYAKLRIISTVAEKRDNRPFVECTFEWTYQPDGSLTFPGK